MKNSHLYPHQTIQTPLFKLWQSYKSHPLAVAGLYVILAIVALTILAPLLAPYGPNEQHSDTILLPPSWRIEGSPDFLLGTDELGRDVFSRLLYGSQIALGLSTLTIITSLFIGVLISIVLSYSPKIISHIILTIINTLRAFPAILLAIIFVLIMDAGLLSTFIAVTLSLTPNLTYTCYSAMKSEIKKDYVSAALLDGSNKLGLFTRIILPNIAPIIIAHTTLSFSTAILEISTLGFLGLGAPPPSPEWGTSLSDAQEVLFQAPWLIILPGIAIFTTTVAINFVGYGLKEAIQKSP